ncbi:hypothetical protein B9Z19DRAFT_1084543 [Tuber borchii]|uniref:Uncharacterized protein n=1 Tax=Tuber borchii TaxID=42251 RepID=A0A2T6ZRW5_TUBBO|nr:hypothetical protein B9Z19DRAFT_1084543 [Tuber borchii]
MQHSMCNGKRINSILTRITNGVLSLKISSSHHSASSEGSAFLPNTQFQPSAQQQTPSPRPTQLEGDPQASPRSPEILGEAIWMPTVGLVHLSKFRKHHVNLAEQRVRGAAERLQPIRGSASGGLLASLGKVVKHPQTAAARKRSSGGRLSRGNSHSRGG